MEFWLPLIISICAFTSTTLQTYFTFRQFRMMKAEFAGRNPDLPELLPMRRLVALWSVVAVLVGLAWIPYLLKGDDLPEWPEPKSYIASYGWTYGECSIVVNGDRFLKYQGRFRLAGACYIYDGTVDVLDIQQVQTSQAYDIMATGIRLRTIWSPGFRKFIEGKQILGISHIILMLPSGVSPDGFSTLRQARALGVRIVPAGSNGIQ